MAGSGKDRGISGAAGIAWTNPSVLSLLDREDEADPLAAIEQRARDVTLEAMEQGWEGPPYDPFALAESLGIELVASQELEDARLVSAEGRPRIDFNPARRPARVRFSIAHEIGHFLFPDYRDRIRYRDQSQRREDDWQLEILCNVAAAEFLMPAGAFPIEKSRDLSLAHLLDLRSEFGVSTEALLRRTIKLTDEPACLFAATRLEDREGFRIDYLVASRAWTPRFGAGSNVAIESVMHRCTAVGFSDEAVEDWQGEAVRVQVVGVPPYPGHSFPRLIGLLTPEGARESMDLELRYVRGDAAQPRRGGAPAIIAHVVNDRARSWGGHGFALSLMQAFPKAREQYEAWASSNHLERGAVHLAEAGDGLWIASLVAQAGYGESSSGRPRLRLFALQRALRNLAAVAQERGAEVHMPAIGTGQGGARWPNVRDLVVEELVDRRIPTTVYVLPDAPMPEDVPADDQLSLI